MIGSNQNAFLICADHNYLPHAGTCAFSILLSTPRRDFDIILATTDLSKENKAKIDRLSELFGAPIHICETGEILASLRDINEHHDKFRPPSLSDATLLRLFYNDFLTKEYNRIAYIDCDVVFTQDANILFAQDLQGHILGAVPDLIVNLKNRVSPDEEFKYFNAGILLIDDKQWRRNQVQQKLIAIMREIDPKHLRLADQDLLNLYFREAGYRELPRRFNHQYLYQLVKNQYLPTGEKLLLDPEVPLSEAVAVHFCGDIKPWQHWAPTSYSQLYSNFRHLSPWGNEYNPAAEADIQKATLAFYCLVDQARYQEACTYAGRLIQYYARRSRSQSNQNPTHMNAS